VQVAAKTLELNGTKPSEEVRRLLTNLQVICYDAHDQAIKAFINKDIGMAENVRQMRIKISALSADIEKTAKEQSLEVLPQTLAITASLMQLYEYSVDMADLVT